MKKKGIIIYGDFVSFCKGLDNEKSFYNSDSETELLESSLSEFKKKVKKLE